MTKEAFILSSIRPMAEYTFPFVTSVVGITSTTAGEQVGSGLRATINGRHAIITARHVIEQANAFALKFAISVGYGRPPHRVTGTIDADPIGDLAVCYLPDDFPRNAPEVSFWPEHRIQRTSERVATDFLFVHGYPAVRARFLSLAAGLSNRSLPYGAMQRLESAVPSRQPFEFAIEFDPAGMRSAAGDDGNVFELPHGLSGSPVWRIGISGRSVDEWTPNLSVVVGFVTKWHPDEKVLIATSAGRLDAVSDRE